MANEFADIPETYNSQKTLADMGRAQASSYSVSVQFRVGDLLTQSLDKSAATLLAPTPGSKFASLNVNQQALIDWKLSQESHNQGKTKLKNHEAVTYRNEEVANSSYAIRVDQRREELTEKLNKDDGAGFKKLEQEFNKTVKSLADLAQHQLTRSNLGSSANIAGPGKVTSGPGLPTQ